MKLTKITLLSALVLTSVGMIYGSQAASAAEVGNTHSEGTIKMVESGGTTTPVDPTDPTKPIDPTDPVNPTTGPLRIEFVSNIRFGEQKISGSTKTYQADFVAAKDPQSGTDIYVPTYAQVADDRGTNVGWHLTVSNTQFTDGTSELTGARLTLGKVFTKNDNSTNNAPTGFDAVLDGDTNAVDVADAAATTGYGISTIGFGEDKHAASATDKNDGVTLEIPGAASKTKDAEYKSELTWTLSDAPA